MGYRLDSLEDYDGKRIDHPFRLRLHLRTQRAQRWEEESLVGYRKEPLEDEGIF